MLKITYAPGDETLAQRLIADLSSAGYTVERAGSTEQTVQDVLIAVLSPAANADDQVQNHLIAALDNSQHIIPVLSSGDEVPDLIAHLPIIDYRQGEDFSALKGAVDAALVPDAARPLRVLTPTVKRTNRRAGILLGLLAILWFALGIYGVAVLGLQAPQEEYNAVDTQAAQTQAFFINPELDQYSVFLPRSTDEALNYEPTLRAVPTVYRPFMAQTATAVSAGTPLATHDLNTPTPAG